MKNIDIHEFFKKYAENKHTENEHKEFVDWLSQQSINKIRKILKDYTDIIREDTAFQNITNHIISENKLRELSKRIDESVFQSNPRVKWFQTNYLKYAAAILIIATSGLFYFKDLNKSKNTETINATTLTLNNGSVIDIDKISSGDLIEENGAKIYKSEDGQLVYDLSDVQESENNQELLYNYLSTPVGKQTFVKLSDGTKVWVNSASSIKFPVTFNRSNREVELDGEAYFEVNKDARPFKVITEKQQIEVLGTHFNVQAYSDNIYTKTTLLEGSVKLTASNSKNFLVLKPGEQGIGDNQTINLKEFDASQTLAWREGRFVFTNEPIYEVMKEIARWYNVQVIYEGKVTNEGFIMNISRSKDIRDVLTKLELTGLVNFKIIDENNINEKKKLIVMP